MPAHRFSLTNTLVMLVATTCFVIIVLDRAGLAPALRPVTTMLYQWTVLLGAFALLLGIVNVAITHGRRIYAGQRAWVGSLALLTTLAAVLLAGLLDGRGASSRVVEWFFDALIAPGQATISALLLFFTATAAFRYLRIGQPAGAWMLAGALVVFLAQFPLFTLPLPLQSALFWLMEQPITATFRGALLGSALALVIVGARFLVGRTEV